MKKEIVTIDFTRSIQKEIVLIPDSKSGFTAHFSDRDDIIVEGETEQECLEKLSETYRIVKSKEFAEDFKNLTQNYLGMLPRDKGCKNWPEMTDKMLEEVAELFEQHFDLEPEKALSLDFDEIVNVDV